MPTARARGINNKVPEHLIPSLKTLCAEVLEPLRAIVKEPIIISSGYRCPQLNAAVGGSKTSQHMLGEAADIRIPKYSFKASDGAYQTNLETLRTWMTWLIDNTDFVHCIKETARPTGFTSPATAIEPRTVTK